MTLKELLQNTPKEQIERLSSCKTIEEILSLTKDLNINLDVQQAEELLSFFHILIGELSDDALDAIVGGYYKTKRYNKTGICAYCAGRIIVKSIDCGMVVGHCIKCMAIYVSEEPYVPEDYT